MTGKAYLCKAGGCIGTEHSQHPGTFARGVFPILFLPLLLAIARLAQPTCKSEAQLAAAKHTLFVFCLCVSLPSYLYQLSFGRGCAEKRDTSFPRRFLAFLPPRKMDVRPLLDRGETGTSTVHRCAGPLPIFPRLSRVFYVTPEAGRAPGPIFRWSVFNYFFLPRCRLR